MIKPKIAISSCLLGEQVRFDGGHKHNPYITRSLGEYFDFVPFCPEVAVGLGVPRPTIRLVRSQGDIRAVSADGTIDPTDDMDAYARTIAPQLDGKVCGYILKKDSPSCGMERVKVYEKEDQPPAREGSGIYARRIMAMLPNLPVEEEGRLMDPGLRENFVERVFAYNRWLDLVDSGITAGSLVDFHTRHKFFIQVHDERTYRELGQLVASVGKRDIHEVAQEYVSKLMQGLRHQATPKKNANVLQHIMGFFKSDLAADDKQELLDLIDAHRRGMVPLVVPITLINHFRRKYPNEYIEDQVYLTPHPQELKLRNHI